MSTPSLRLCPTSHVTYRPAPAYNPPFRKHSRRPRFPIYHSLYDVLESAPIIHFDSSTRLVFFGDCHRGAGDWSDQFQCNATIYRQALKYYLEQGFAYVELGDGDELWKGASWANIRRAHREVFALLNDFNQEGRLYMVWGNHDIAWSQAQQVLRPNGKQDYLSDPLEVPLSGVQRHEGLLFKHEPSGCRLLAAHGHQVDLLSSRLMMLSRFIVGTFWKQLHRLGFRDPTSPAQNHAIRNRLERRITRWILDTRHMVLCGHTHRPVFPQDGHPPYFNVGSCIRPGSVTCVEICNGDIALIEWHTLSGLGENISPRLARTLLAPPRRLADCAIG